MKFLATSSGIARRAVAPARVAIPTAITVITLAGRFEYRVALSPATSAQVARGAGGIDVTLIRLPGHSPAGRAPSASAPVGGQSGAGRTEPESVRSPRGRDRTLSHAIARLAELVRRAGLEGAGIVAPCINT
jgi:hypothetical protein